MALSPWTSEDLEQMKANGINPAEASRQLEMFRHPPPSLTLDRPALVGDGIHVLDLTRQNGALRIYEEARQHGRFMKFVPASGAASRMFQLLTKYLQRPSMARNELEQEAFAGDKDSRQVLEFMNALAHAAFYGDLKALFARRGKNLKTVQAEGGYRMILEALLDKDGLDYSHKPKGLVKFHSYGPEKRTAFEEHLLEAVRYAQDGQKTCKIHFTVSDDHLAEYRDFLASVKERFEKSHGVRLEVDFSIQELRTNTLAVDLNNEPFRDAQGKLLFRPSGHGALLGNLNDFQGDLVFMKNVDNVTTESRLEMTAHWKRVLGGFLASIQEQIFSRLRGLASKTGSEVLKEIQGFTRSDLGIDAGKGFNSAAREQKAETLKRLLNRPIRVCGVVPNKGEPGGGPFWVKGSDGRVSLQIVESAQIDQSRPDQKEIMQKSTHFNPVDLVCGVRDWQGKPFDLRRYSDANAIFISRKSYQGRELKALELPGLWNGAMSDWITMFVEVPLETFNPVKTAFDLLRPTHQA
jgi:hypothetical protein